MDILFSCTFQCESSKLVCTGVLGHYKSEVDFAAWGVPGGVLTLHLEGEQKLFWPGEQYEVIVRKYERKE